MMMGTDVRPCRTCKDPVVVVLNAIGQPVGDVMCDACRRALDAMRRYAQQYATQAKTVYQPQVPKSCDMCGVGSASTHINTTAHGDFCDSCIKQMYPPKPQPVCDLCGVSGTPLRTIRHTFFGNLCQSCYGVQLKQASQQKQQAQQGAKKVAYQKRYSGNVSQSGTVGSPSGTPQCSFTWDVPRQAYAINADYQQNFLEFIKAKVPVSDRVPEYDSVTRKFKCWYIKEAWYDILYELAVHIWGPSGVRAVTKEDAERAWKAQEDARKAALAAQRQAVLGPFEAALLDFCSLCDIDALRAARNKMAIALHPDKGGDPDKMAKLNASWFIVETELRKRS